MNPKIIFQKIICNSKDIQGQRAVACGWLFNLTGKRVKHSKSGRPIIGRTMDVSISHKNNLAYIGIAPRPYRIGVDVEHIKNDINTELFLKWVITKKETLFLRTFCKKGRLSLSSGIAVFWSVKEAFFKCLDYDLKPGKISILNIRKNNRIKINCSDEIKCLMRKKKLKLYFAWTIFNKKHIFSQTIMIENSS